MHNAIGIEQHLMKEQQGELLYSSRDGANSLQIEAGGPHLTEHLSGEALIREGRYFEQIQYMTSSYSME